MKLKDSCENPWISPGEFRQALTKLDGIYRFIFVCGFLFFQLHVSDAQTANYSLNELTAISYANNPQLKASEKTTQIGLKQIEYLDKEELPQIFFDVSISRWKYLLPNKQKLLGNSLNDLYADFRINQLVYDWKKNSIQKTIINKSADIDRNYGRKLRQALAYSVAKNYLELLKIKRIVQIKEDAIHQLKEHLRNAEALYNIGKVSSLDVLKASVQIEIALDESSKAKNQLQVQKNNLNVLCGTALGDSFDVVDPIDDWWKDYSSKNFNWEELKNVMTVQHPELTNIKIQKALKRQEIKLLNKEYYPDIYAFGITNVEDGRWPMGNLNWNYGFTVSYSMPFFRGSNFKIKVEQSNLKIEVLQENEESVLQQLETNVRNNLLKLDDDRSRLSGMQRIIALAEESLATANLKYNIGQGGSLDVLDAETVLTTARLTYNQVIIDFLTTIAELNYNLGSDEMPLSNR